MFCSKCGTQNENNAQFCSSCSYKFKESSSIVPQPEIIVYAGFWTRFIAALIDLIILLLFGAITDYRFGFILHWLYFALLESSSKQATLGKMAIGIIVTDLNNNRISFGKATIRHFSKILSLVIFFIGFFMAGFTKKKQALHDIIADTLVVIK